MTLHDALTIVGRRLWIVLLVPLIGGGAAWLAGDPAGSADATYRGEATLTLTAGEETRAVELYTYIATETVEIERGVEATLGRAVEGEVVVEPIQTIGAIRLSALGQPDEVSAELVVRTYAAELSDYATSRRIIDRDNRLAQLATREVELELQVERLSAELKQLQQLQPAEEVGQSVDRVKETTLLAASEALADVLNEQDELQTGTDADLTPFEPLGPTSAQSESSGADPLGRTGRLILGVLLGLVLGVILALGLHRFDTRLFTRREAEMAYSLPVLAEIPRTSWRMRRHNKIIAREYPTHPAAEAHRVLRSNIAWARSVQRTEMDTSKHAPGTVVLVTSASSAVGKSTTVANLAVVSADAGNSVLVVGADLRYPTIHDYFGVEPSAPGLAEAGAARRVGELDAIDRYVLPTNEPGVSLLPHGHVVVNPGDVLADALPLLDAVRRRFDLVIVDSTPMLAGNDVDELLPAADLVVQVARSGRTTYDEGVWTDEAIQRRRTPTVGLVLIGASSDLARRSAARRRPSVRTRISGLFRRLLGRAGPSLPTIAPIHAETEIDADMAAHVPTDRIGVSSNGKSASDDPRSDEVEVDSRSDDDDEFDDDEFGGDEVDDDDDGDGGDDDDGARFAHRVDDEHADEQSADSTRLSDVSPRP